MPDLLGDAFYQWPYYACLGLAYLLGSIPFGLILTRLAGLGDIRKVGSGNIGATNVLRTGNKLIALAVLLLDAGKGALAVLLAWQYGPDMAVFAAAGAVIGHCFPIWLKFRGGKAVATFLGAMLGLSLIAGAAACATWLAVAALSRKSSVAGMGAALSAPVWLYLLDGPRAVLCAAVLALWVVLRHHANIHRLIAGTEPRIGGRSGDAGDS